MPAPSPEIKLAERLAAPFARAGERGKPLSYRLLPEGGMVVISADGRKLWFTLEEVNRVREELGMKTVAAKKRPQPPPEEPPNPAISSRPPAGTRDGKSEMIVLPPDLKHIEKMIHDKTRRH
jgi:hypothetical protein